MSPLQADESVEVSDDTDGVINVPFAHFFIRGNAVNAFFQQVVARVAQNADGFEHRPTDAGSTTFNCTDRARRRWCHR